MTMTRRTLLAGLGACGVGLPAYGAAATSVPGHAPGHRAGAVPAIRMPNDVTAGEQATISSLRTTQPVVAMTFDDGPHPRLTPVLLDMLKSAGLRATFYVIGNRVELYPGLIRRMLQEGHEIGNHSWSHPFLTKLGADDVRAQLDATTRAIYNVTGKVPVTMRPPYGALSANQRLMVHQTRKFPTVLWSVDPQDWRRPGADVVAQRILGATRPGGIVLSHDIHSGTIKAMPATLNGLLAKGFQFVTVSEMLGWPRWHTRQFKLGTVPG